MNELKESLKVILEFVESSKGFVIEQTPLYVQELLTYLIIIDSIGVGIASAFLIISVVLPILIYRKYRETDTLIACITVGSIVGFISLISFIANLMHLIKVLVAPRLIVVEHISKMLQ